MNRWLALLLATLGGAISAWFAMMMFFGLVVGVLWLFVFGDDPWPDWILNDLEIGLILVGLVIWAVISRAIWTFCLKRGKKAKLTG